MSTADREAALFLFIRTRLAERLKVPSDRIGASTGLLELGLQSIDAVLLCGEIEDEFGVELDPSLIFGHPTLAEFASAVLERFPAA